MQLGYAELFDFHFHTFGHQLPPTCKGATRCDSLLPPPLLQSLMLHAKVDETSHRFDAHNPLLVTFRADLEEPIRTWRMPETFLTFAPDMEAVAETYARDQAHLVEQIQACSTTQEVGQAFEAWASGIEEAIDSTLTQAHRQGLGSSLSSLPSQNLPEAAVNTEQGYRPLCLSRPKGQVRRFRPCVRSSHCANKATDQAGPPYSNPVSGPASVPAVPSAQTSVGSRTILSGMGRHSAQGVWAEV